MLLFSGYYGFGNAGDEAVLQASVGMLRARRQGIEIGALSADPAGTAAAYGIRAWHRMRPGGVRAALREAEVLLSGGGSLLQDRTSLRSLLYYVGIIHLALAMRRRVMIFAQGIGPLHRPAARRLVARLLRRTHLITVRDEGSRQLLRELGSDGPGWPRVLVTADPVYALEPERSARVEALLEAARRRGSPLVAVALRPWEGMEKAAEAVAGGLREAYPGAAVLGCPLQPGEDGPLCGVVAGAVGAAGGMVNERLRPGEWAALLGGVDLVVAARLHALIFAAAAGTPAAGIAYDPKVAAQLTRAGQVDLGPPADVTPRGLVCAADALARSRDDREARSARVAVLRREAALSAELALEFVRSPE